MRRAVWLLVLGALGAVLGVASARASGSATTTTATTTSTGTTTTTTTSSSTPSYAPLAASSLPAGCVGAGAAAVVSPSGSVVALGTPASDLGPAAYPASAPVVAFSSMSVSGSACKTTTVSLGAVSLFGGAVTASGVGATAGRGSVGGLEIDGTAVSAAPGQTLQVEGWGLLTLGERVGRLTAPLGLRLLESRDGLAAGTTIAVAFSATPLPGSQPREKRHASPSAGRKSSTTKTSQPQQPAQPPPDYPATSFPFLLSGGLTPAARHDPVVSIAVKYLGVPYRWAGESPKTGFDCSGLVTYVFAQLGVSLPHYTVAQWNSPEGVYVSPKRLEPGDLVFFIGADGTRKAPGHVGIYVGDGYFIDAPNTGAKVRIDSLSAPAFANQFVGARRIDSRLLAARHLLVVTKPATRTFLPGFAAPASFGTAAAAPTLVRTSSSGHWIWAGAVPGGLLLLLLAGAFVFRRGPRWPGRA